jgi:hypothetical protein
MKTRTKTQKAPRNLRTLDATALATVQGGKGITMTDVIIS